VRDAASKERGGAEAVLANLDRNHLRRAMNLRVGLFYILKESQRPLSAARTGPVAVLAGRGCIRWLEAYVSLVVRMKPMLGLRTRGRAGRIAFSGGFVAAMGDDDEMATTPASWTASGSAERRELLEAASRSVKGDQDALSLL
jgi:hypothetical protein